MRFPQPGDKLDFSQFHPLDHFPGSARCRMFFGGWRHHLAITWEYRRKDQLRRYLLCPFGRHDWREWFERTTDPSVWKPAGHVCPGCGKTRS